MKLATLTVTGKTGPGFTVTAKVFHNVQFLTFNFARNTFSFSADEGSMDFDYDTTATVTFTISGDAATIAIS